MAHGGHHGASEVPLRAVCGREGSRPGEGEGRRRRERGGEDNVHIQCSVRAFTATCKGIRKPMLPLPPSLNMI